MESTIRIKESTETRGYHEHDDKLADNQSRTQNQMHTHSFTRSCKTTGCIGDVLRMESYKAKSAQHSQSYKLVEALNLIKLETEI